MAPQFRKEAGNGLLRFAVDRMPDPEALATGESKE